MRARVGGSAHDAAGVQWRYSSRRSSATLGCPDIRESLLENCTRITPSPRLQCGVAGGERLVDVHHSILGLGDVGGVVLDGAAHDADNSSNGSVQPAEASTSVYTVARDVAAQSRWGRR
jgi:hypothetical protein